MNIETMMPPDGMPSCGLCKTPGAGVAVFDVALTVCAMLMSLISVWGASA